MPRTEILACNELKKYINAEMKQAEVLVVSSFQDLMAWPKLLPEILESKPGPWQP